MFNKNRLDKSQSRIRASKGVANTQRDLTEAIISMWQFPDTRKFFTTYTRHQLHTLHDPQKYLAHITSRYFLPDYVAPKQYTDTCKSVAMWSFFSSSSTEQCKRVSYSFISFLIKISITMEEDLHRDFHSPTFPELTRSGVHYDSSATIVDIAPFQVTSLTLHYFWSFFYATDVRISDFVFRSLVCFVFFVWKIPEFC